MRIPQSFREWITDRVEANNSSLRVELKKLTEFRVVGEPGPELAKPIRGAKVTRSLKRDVSPNFKKGAK
jgi:hypothetical protein